MATEYSNEIVDKIFSELANTTKGLAKICKENNISCPKFREFIVCNTEVGNKYTHARTLQIENMEEQVMALGDELALAMAGKGIDPDTNEVVVIDPQMASAHVSLCRVRIDALKWILSKLAPKKYGDKLDVTSDNKPVNVALSVADAKAISDKLNSEV